jgi:hypothetical protein
MSPTAFLPGEGADDDSLRHIEKGLELEGLHEIRIKHLPFVLYRHRDGTMGQCSESRYRSRHGFVSPNEAKIEAHQLAQVFSKLPGSNGSLLCQQSLNATLLDCKLIGCERLWRDGSYILTGSNSSPPPEHNRFKERVPSQSIGAVHTDTGTFTGRIEAGDACFSPLIGLDPAHLIVRAGTDGNGSLDGIEAGKLNGKFSDLREAFQDALASQMPQVQQHAPVDSPAFEDFLPDGQ